MLRLRCHTLLQFNEDASVFDSRATLKFSLKELKCLGLSLFVLRPDDHFGLLDLIQPILLPVSLSGILNGQPQVSSYDGPQKLNAHHRLSGWSHSSTR